MSVLSSKWLEGDGGSRLPMVTRQTFLVQPIPIRSSRDSMVSSVEQWFRNETRKMVNGYMPLPSSLHPYNLMTMLGSHSVMSLFRVVVCVPAVSYTLRRSRRESLLLGTPGVGCVTCLLALFLASVFRSQPRSPSSAFVYSGVQKAVLISFRSTPCPCFTLSVRSSQVPLLSLSEYRSFKSGRRLTD